VATRWGAIVRLCIRVRIGHDESLVACFERVAATYPTRTALVSEQWQLTYDQLSAAANRLARALVARGATPGDRIAILMRHDSPQIVAMLAALKAGAIVVPLNPTFPTTRLRKTVEDAEPRLIVTDKTNRDLATGIASSNFGIVSFEEQSVQGPSDNLSIAIDPNQVAFLVYTSGSTGSPKGVMQTHRQRVRHVQNHTDVMRYAVTDKIPLFASLNHSQAIGTTLCALLNGATLFPFSVAIKGVAGLRDWMIENKITVYVSSASIFRTFMKVLDSCDQFPHVHAIRLASESATSDDFEQFQKHFSGTCVFVHTLSSSETLNIARSRWLHSDKVQHGRLPLEVMASDNKVLLLDENDVPMNQGEVGEIIVRSCYLAAGYWRNPALTAERFSDASDGSGDRLFRTGDLARINAEGMLEFVGRKDHRVKIRGNRIELTEVADGLRRLPGIKQAVIEAIPRPNDEPTLVGYVVLGDDVSWSPALMRSALRAILPDYMLPSTLIRLDNLPSTPSGKIDREQLRQMYLQREQQSLGQCETETEVLLAGIWAEVFESTDIGRHDDFFQRGGDSLIAAVVAAESTQQLGLTSI
jgi:amino acid adenylation domain-containing protein